MKRLLQGFLLGFFISMGLYNIEEQIHSETMTVVSAGYNDNSIYGYNKGFWEYWANNVKTGNSYHGISFYRIEIGQKVRIKR